MLAPLRRATSRGSALLIVCAVTGILLTIVLVLHYQEAVSRAAVAVAEGDLEARQVGRYALGRQLGRTQQQPPRWLSIASTDKFDGAALVGPTAAGPLFENAVRTGLRNLFEKQAVSFNPKIIAAPGSGYFDFAVRSAGSGLSFGTLRYLGVTTEYGTCAIAAPNGKVKVVGDTTSWGNPKDKRERTAGIPLDVEAGQGVDMRGLDYGHVWCNSGQVKLDRARFNGIAHWGLSPNPVDVGRLVEAGNGAVAALRARAIDKTPYFTKTAPGIRDVYKGLARFPTSSDKDFFNDVGLKGANSYPLGIFWTISSLAKSFGVYQMSIDVPYIPDGGGDSEFETAANWVVDKWLWLVGQLDQLVAQIEKAQAAVDWLQKHFPPLAPAAKLVVDGLIGVLQGIVAGVQTYASAVMMAVIFIQMAHQKDPPNNRPEEVEAVRKGTLSKMGRTNWGYKESFQAFFTDSFVLNPTRLLDLLKAIGNVFTDFEFAQLNIVFNMNERVRLVWFGRNGSLDGFGLDGPITIPATLDVPRERSLRFSTGMTIKGDLWLQRGSVLVIDGDLRVQRGSSDDWAPTGRVVLEDGATLIVNGNFTCQGTPRGGSVLVSGVMGAVHPITSAILCSGNVEIPYGTRSGFAWDDEAISKDALITDLMQPLAQGRAASLARTDGPFHPRLPYIAKYQTSFAITTKPPMIVPLPLQSKNVLAHIMRGLGILESAMLNARLGENLLTHADWWYAPGVVPAALKADFPAFRTMPRPAIFTGKELEKDQKTALEAGQEALNSNSLYMFTYAARFAVWQRYAQAAASFAKDAINEKLKEMGKSTIPVGVPLLPDGIFPDYVATMDKLEEKVKKGQPDSAALKQVLNEVHAGMWNKTVGADLTLQQVRQECGGILISAGGVLAIGYKDGAALPRTDCRLAAGLLVARGDVRVNAESTIGALRSRDGSVTVTGDLFFYPPFTSASLYLPRAEPPDWMDRLVNVGYGGKDDPRPQESRCLPIGGVPTKVTAWGPQ